MSKPRRPTTPPDPNEGLPANLDAEKFVLGQILRDAATHMPPARELQPVDFALKKHQIIFRRAMEVDDRGETVDDVTVANELARHKELASSGGPSYILSLLDGLPHIPSIASHIRIVKDKAALRQIIFGTDALSKRCFLQTENADTLIGAGADIFGKLAVGRNHREEAPSAPTWPDPIQDDGFHGIAGELVRLIEPHTEADPAALLVQFLVAWGSLVGRGAYYLAEEDRHHTNLFCVLVGVTSKGRKGTSWGRMRGVLNTIDEHWAGNCLVSGLGSGEALIDALNNEDRRRLVLEGEFARLLAIIAREGTTISSIFRQCWDMGEAHVTVRGKEAHVTGGHLSMIAHVTKDELRRRLSDVEMGNGFGNRILWVCARRSKELPFGGGSIDFGNILLRLSEATDFARKAGNSRMRLDRAASDLWEQVYHDLSEGKPGLFGAVTGRAEAQVVRLSVLYALLDRASEIRVEHLRAALSVWRYCEDSARYIWGDLLGDPSADAMLQAIRANANGLTRLDVYNLFSGHKGAAELDRAAAVLIERGLIRTQKEESNGRPTLRYLRA